MAGFYPDAPANRFALHLDGTKAYTKDSANNLYEVTGSLGTLFNEEDDDLLDFAYRTSLIFIFPELRDIAAYYFNGNGYIGAGTMQVSSDTVNGLDGTWTTIASPWVNRDTSVTPDYRTNFNAVTAGGIKAVRFNNSGSQYADIRAVHLYGAIPQSENPDRLIFWEPVNDNPTPGAWFDWGDIQQGSSATKQFRIKNNSPTLTANDVTLSSGAVTFSMSLEFSLDGVTYTASPNVGTLTPGSLSGIIYTRRTVPSNEPLRPQTCTIRASAASWSQAGYMVPDALTYSCELVTTTAAVSISSGIVYSYETVVTTPAASVNDGMVYSFEYVVTTPPANRSDGTVYSYENVAEDSPSNPTQIYVWDGTQWVHKPIYVWNGSTWVATS